MALGKNRVLGNPATPAAARPHRVAIASWPTTIEDVRTRSIEALMDHVAGSGYEGCEFSTVTFERYFPGASPAVIARKGAQAMARVGLRNFGATDHITDEEMRALRWDDAARDRLKPIIDMGGEFASYQLFLHPDYLNTGGAYRGDEAYLQWCADRVAKLREIVWDHGLNFYLEVHVDRMTEDPGACCRILDMATCELNGDMSHFLARGFTRGVLVDRVLKHVGHTHVRMARKLGDLSASVPDPRADWDAEGVTWQMFQFMMPALDGGLSSRTIAGESGPMHLVTDTLTQDAVLVPLYRAMARYADATAQGMQMRIESPSDLRPWG